MVEHKHLMISADFLRDIFSTSWYETWMSGLIEDLDMTPLVEPKAVRDKTKGNEGITAFSIITTILLKKVPINFSILKIF